MRFRNSRFERLTHKAPGLAGGYLLEMLAPHLHCIVADAQMNSRGPPLLFYRRGETNARNCASWRAIDYLLVMVLSFSDFSMI